MSEETITDDTVDEQEEEQFPPVPVTMLRTYHDTLIKIEKFRIQVGNGLSAFERGSDSAEARVPKVLQVIYETAQDLESKLDTEIQKEIRNYPIWNEWMSHVKGIGPSIGGSLLAMLHTPTPEKGPSSWYKAAGLGPELRPNGEFRLPRARAGEGKITYYPHLRKRLFVLGESFIKTKGYYRTVYDQAKATLFRQHCWEADKFLQQWRSTSLEARLSWLERFAPTDTKEKITEAYAVEPTYAKAIALWGISDPRWPLIQIDRVARWKMVKLFLSHLWEKWCAIDGIHNRGPYILSQYGGHTTFIPAPEWNGKEKI